MTTDLAKAVRPEWMTTPLLTSSLPPQELDKHRAWIGVKVEAVLHGYWQSSPAPMVKAEIVKGWMDALQNYTKPEIIAAFSKHVADNPNKRPNEGHIRGLIISARSDAVAAIPKPPEPEREPPATKEQAAAILNAVGFSIRRATK